MQATHPELIIGKIVYGPDILQIRAMLLMHSSVTRMHLIQLVIVEGLWDTSVPGSKAKSWGFSY